MTVQYTVSVLPVSNSGFGASLARSPDGWLTPEKHTSPGRSRTRASFRIGFPVRLLGVGILYTRQRADIGEKGHQAVQASSHQRVPASGRLQSRTAFGLHRKCCTE